MIVDTRSKGFLHLTYVLPFMGPSNIAAVEAVLAGASDWIRYAPYGWIIYSGHDPAFWSRRLSTITTPKMPGFLLSAIGPDGVSGLADSNVWDWLNKTRSGNEPELLPVSRA